MRARTDTHTHTCTLNTRKTFTLQGVRACGVCLKIYTNTSKITGAHVLVNEMPNTSRACASMSWAALMFWCRAWCRLLRLFSRARLQWYWCACGMGYANSVRASHQREIYSRVRVYLVFVNCSCASGFARFSTLLHTAGAKVLGKQQTRVYFAEAKWWGVGAQYVHTRTLMNKQTHMENTTVCNIQQSHRYTHTHTRSRKPNKSHDVLRRAAWNYDCVNCLANTYNILATSEYLACDISLYNITDLEWCICRLRHSSFGLVSQQTPASLCHLYDVYNGRHRNILFRFVWVVYDIVTLSILGSSHARYYSIKNALLMTTINHDQFLLYQVDLTKCALWFAIKNIKPRSLSLIDSINKERRSLKRSTVKAAHQ